MAATAGVSIEKFEATGDKVNVTLSALSDTKIYVNGTLQNGTAATLADGTAINTYNVCITLNQAENYFGLKAEKGGKSYPCRRFSIKHI